MKDTPGPEQARGERPAPNTQPRPTTGCLLGVILTFGLLVYFVARLLVAPGLDPASLVCKNVLLKDKFIYGGENRSGIGRAVVVGFNGQTVTVIPVTMGPMGGKKFSVPVSAIDRNAEMYSVTQFPSGTTTWTCPPREGP